MRAIVVGAGKLGFELANRLSREGLDVVVVDPSAERLREIERNLDVMTIEGSGASPAVLEQSGVPEAGLLIGVTGSDETNLLSCMVGKKAGAKMTVARVRGSDYEPSLGGGAIGPKFGVDMIINPEHQAALEIARVLKNPGTHEVEYLADGKVQMISFTVEAGSTMDETKVKDLNVTSHTIVAIIRDGQVHIPSGDTEILAGDQVFLVGKRGLLTDFGWKARTVSTRLRNLTIVGGSPIGYFLARALEPLTGHGVRLRLIEKSEECCRKCAASLEHTIIINGDGSYPDLLEEESVNESDAAAVVTEDEKTNLLTGYLLKHMGVQRVVASIKRESYMPLAHRMGIDSTVIPRIVAASTILKIARRQNVLSVALLKEGNAELIELLVEEGSYACGRAIVDLGIPRGAVIGSVVRNGSVIVPRGNTRIQRGDHVIVFSLSASARSVETVFQSS